MNTSAHVCLVGSFIVGVLGIAQVMAQAPASADGRPTFDVTSVKRNTSGEQGGRSGYQPGGRYSGTNVTVRRVIGLAYLPLQGFQIIGGPNWINSDRFDIEAKAEGNPSSDQLRLMLRALLADRFKLVTHREMRELPAYALVLARTDGTMGAQLRRSEVDCSAQRGNAPPPTPQGARSNTGQAPSCGFFVGVSSLAGKGTTMERFAAELSLVGRPVLNRTGLSGSFDVDLKWAPDAGAGAPSSDSGASIFTALQEQLGLKLEAIKTPMEVLVIDSVEQPTPD